MEHTEQNLSKWEQNEGATQCLWVDHEQAHSESIKLVDRLSVAKVFMDFSKERLVDKHVRSSARPKMVARTGQASRRIRWLG